MSGLTKSRLHDRTATAVWTTTDHGNYECRALISSRDNSLPWHYILTARPHRQCDQFVFDFGRWCLLLSLTSNAKI